MLTLCAQYLLLPLSLALTILPPIVFFLINRKYVWFSLLLTATAEVIINWNAFCYYESRGLAIIFTSVQIAVMAIIILILGLVPNKKKQ